MVVGSFQLKMLSVRQGTQHFTDENKVSRKWSDSVHLITSQLNKNNTITHRVLVVKIQNQNQPSQIKTPFITRHIHKLTWDQQSKSTLVPNLFNVCQLFVTIGVTIIVALFLPLFNTLFTVLMFSFLHYRTSQNTSQVSQLNFSKSQCKVNTSFSK